MHIGQTGARVKRHEDRQPVHQAGACTQARQDGRGEARQDDRQNCTCAGRLSTRTPLRLSVSSFLEEQNKMTLTGWGGGGQEILTLP